MWAMGCTKFRHNPVEAVTPEDVQRVSQAYLQPSQFYTGIHQPIVTARSGVKWGGILIALIGLGGLGVYGWRKPVRQ